MARHLSLSLVVLALTMPTLAGQEKFLGKSVDAWTAQLKAGDAPSRRSAAYALGKMGRASHTALPAMRDAFMREKDSKVRDALLFALGEICRFTRSAELEPTFLAGLKDGDPYVRRSAAFALGCLPSQSDAVLTALDDALRDDASVVRQNAIWALMQFRDDDKGDEGRRRLPSFAKGLRDPESQVKREAANALLRVKDGDKVHDLLNDLLALCKDANPEMRKAGLNVVQRIVDPGDKQALPVLAAALKDRDPEIKRTAALALSNIGGEGTAIALTVLLETAKNGDLELRRQAVLAIRNIGPGAAPAVKDLIGILESDADAKMREHAALALGGIGKDAEPALPLLAKKIQDVSEKKEIRKEAAMAMARMGPVAGAAEHVPALLGVLTDARQEPTVRERIVWALRVHGANLRNMKGPLEAFTDVLKEAKNLENKMIRYDCAYMLGMIWQREAPDLALDVLGEFLADPTIKIYLKTDSAIAAGGIESGAGDTKLAERGEGDGRVMACDALQYIGAPRYAARPAVMQQLRVLALDKNTYPPLRKKAADLIR